MFDASVYLSSNNSGRYACLLPDAAADGPLHVRIAWPPAYPNGRFQMGEAWHVENSVLHCGRVRLLLRHAIPWIPERLDQLSMSGGRDVALRLCVKRWGRLSHRSAALGAVMGGTGPWPLFAKQATNSLRSWLSGEAEATTGYAAVSALAGLGDGLTPAGDDLLGGLALMLRAQSSAHLAPLRGAVMPCLQRTHPISAAHLREALDGRASAPALVALRGLLDSNDEAVETACAQLGHTSGWDMLAGMLLAATSDLGTTR